MSKEIEWYLIYHDEHLGPYSESNLMELYEGGELKSDTQIWREGLDAPKIFGQVFLNLNESTIDGEFVNLAHLSEIITEPAPPDLPVAELSVEDDAPPPLDFLNNKESIDPEESDSPPPPIPVMVEDNGDITVKESVVQNSNSNSIWVWISLGIFLFFVFIGICYTQNMQRTFNRPAGLGVSEYKRLLNTAKSDSENNEFSFSLSLDKKSIWISTNSDLSGEVNFRFSNQNQKNLGDGAIEIQGVVKLNNHLMQIKDFEFIQGAKFIDGQFDVDLFTTTDLELPFLTRLFSNKDRQFKFKKTVLISNLSQEDFEKALLSRKLDEDKNEVEFFETLAEEYRTVQTITNQILSGLKSIFAAGDVNRAEALDKFDKDYKRNYGVFFTSFVLSVDKKYEMISRKDFKDKVEVIAHYAKLKKLALTVGETSVEQLNKIREIDLMSSSPSELREIEFNSTLKYKEIIIECEKMINSLKND